MTKTVPTSWTDPDLSLYKLFERVTHDDWQQLIEQQHYLWSRSGQHWGGRIWNPPWQTTDTSYTVTDAGIGGYDLDTWYAVGRAHRVVEDAAKSYDLTLHAYARHLDLRATFTRIDTAGTTALGSAVASTATGDSEWISATLNITEANAYDGGSTSNDLAPIVVYIEGKESTGSGTAKLWQHYVREKIGVAADMPDS